MTREQWVVSILLESGWADKFEFSTDVAAFAMLAALKAAGDTVRIEHRWVRAAPVIPSAPAKPTAGALTK